MSVFAAMVFSLALLVVRGGSQIESCLSQNINLSNKTSDFWMFSEIILKHDTPSSVIECAVKCIQDARCITFMVNEKSKRCRLHAAIVSELSLLESADGFVSYDTCRATPSVIGHPCETDTSCTLQHSECNGQVCQCQVGYSFSPPLKSCVTACSEYGNEFVTFENWYISSHNDKEFDDTASVCPECCQKRCAEETSFLCRTSELTSSKCLLSKVTSKDVPDQFFYFETVDIIHYQRQCGFD